MEKWEITIDKHRGFCPKWYENSYASYGNKEQASDMRNISLIDPSSMKPGPGMAELTAGDQAGAVTTLIKGILRHAVSSNSSYAVGGAKLYTFSATAVTNAGIWPHAIDKATVTGEDGEDVAYYQSKLYYSYNHSGTAGDMGQYDLSTTFDDDYFNAAATGGAALQSAPHQLINGGDDVLYITNGQYMAYLDGTTANATALDFWTNAQVSSATWNYNRVIVAVNRPNVSGTNFNQSGIYRWNGYASSWEGDPAEVNGRIGALYTKNGVTYTWHEEFIDGSSRLVFGMLSGLQITPIRTFSGTLPLYYQVGEMSDFIIWLSGQRLYAFGPLSSEVESDLFQLMSPQYATGGGISSPFGEVLIASNATTNYSLEKENGYALDSYYKTLLFETSKETRISKVDEVQINVNKLATGAKADLTLIDNAGTSLWTDSVSYATDGAVTKKRFFPKVAGENILLKIDHTNGSATNPVAVRNTIIKGKNFK